MRLKPAQLILIFAVCAASLAAGYLAQRLMNPLEADTALTVDAASLPETLPPFTLEDTHGQMRSSDEWAGKVLVINFWATWCEPCREEMLEIIGIAVDDAEAARRFGDDLGILYPSLIAGRDGGFELLEVHNPHGVLPFTLVVDGDGNITQRKIGVWTRDELEAAVAKASG